MRKREVGLIVPAVFVGLTMIAWIDAEAQTPPASGPVPAPSGIPAQPEASNQAPTTIEGEIVRIDGEYYVVKDSKGRELRLQVGQDTEMAGAFKPGDKVEVQTSAIEHATIIMAAVDQSAMPSRTILGELVKMEDHYVVVKDPEGKELRLHVSKHTHQAGAFKPGDKIEVRTSPVAHAIFIRATK